MAIVYLPSEIAHRTGDLDSLVIDAPRVHELMQILAERFPEIADLLPRMAVAVDGEIYNDPDYIDLGPASEVHLVPRISGGQPTGRHTASASQVRSQRARRDRRVFPG